MEGAECVRFRFLKFAEQLISRETNVPRIHAIRRLPKIEAAASAVSLSCAVSCVRGAVARTHRSVRTTCGTSSAGGASLKRIMHAGGPV